MQARLFEKRSRVVKKLINYDPTNINRVRLGSHVRYFGKDKKGIYTFKSGGFLVDKQRDKVVLSNGQISWVVNKKHTSFWKKRSDEQTEKVFKNQKKTDEWIKNIFLELVKLEKDKTKGLSSLPPLVKRKLPIGTL